MRLRSSGPFWPIKNGLVSNYPSLGSSLSCEVAIVGGGLCGSFIAYYLAEAGIDTVIVDKRDFGAGSTSASTALVMYEIDVLLSDLIKIRGEGEAVRSYKLCEEATDKIRNVVRKLGGNCGFREKNSLYLASRVGDKTILKTEYETRRRFGFDVDFLDRHDIEGTFSFSRSAALLSSNDAEVDPYLLTHALLKHAEEKGLRAFDRTEVRKYKRKSRGVEITTDRGFRVDAKKVVFATGFESPNWIKQKVVKLKSTYAIATEPLEKFIGWGYDQCLIWESSRPYLYIRTTSDGRIIIGGEDEDFVNPTRRDRLIPTKAATLLRKVRRLFPKMNLELAYAWAGTFGETGDGLPYVGEPSFPNIWFALCFGANGTNFAQMASEIIRDSFLGKENSDSSLFRFDR
jgi:glycine/D-amino acid oxidase-like deaminating enzyme